MVLCPEESKLFFAWCTFIRVHFLTVAFFVPAKIIHSFMLHGAGRVLTKYCFCYLYILICDLFELIADFWFDLFVAVLYFSFFKKRLKETLFIHLQQLIWRFTTSCISRFLMQDNLP